MSRRAAASLPMHELRSDTFTRPTAGMRTAMARAEVGDDVWGEDPTVRALEETVAHALGKEAGLFVASGTMGNAIGVRLHAAQGDELYAHERAHVMQNEGGGAAALWGVFPRQLPGNDGFIDVAALERYVPPADDDVLQPRARLVCLENTSMAAGGAPWPRERLAAVAEYARGRGLRVHLDGARLFNAAIAQRVDASALAAHADTVSICLSKGLGAPVGSVVAGSAVLIGEARRLRTLLGGAMRQSGVIAAAGLYALEHHLERLADDHENARLLADALAATKRLEVDPERVATNVVLARCARAGDTAAAVCADLAGVGVLAAPYDARTVRFVTSLEVDRAAVTAAIRAANPVLR